MGGSKYHIPCPVCKQPFRTSNPAAAGVVEGPAMPNCVADLLDFIDAHPSEDEEQQKKVVAAVCAHYGAKD